MTSIATSSCWPSLKIRQRQFLLVAHEIEHARHPFDIAAIQWRKVGALCGLDAVESDEMVEVLSELGLVQVDDAQRRTMSLVGGADLIQQVIDTRTAEMAQWIRAPHC
jgi:hypothetical protein